MPYSDLKFNKAMSIDNRDLVAPSIMKAKWSVLGPDGSPRCLDRISLGPLSKVSQKNFYYTFSYMVSYKHEVVKHLQKRGREAIVVQRILALFDVRQPDNFA